jgi:L-idonate 5-dehydrogenase
MTDRALRLHAVHDLRLETLPAPDPGPGEVTVRLGAGGICGSDLHYFHDGGIGRVRVREPIVLGHEAAGTVEAAGPGAGLAPGQAVALNPSRPCGSCRSCAEGLAQHCLAMRFAGSAMFLPHAQGFFRDRLTLPAAQCVPLPEGTSLAEGACAEPLAVCLHALAQAPELAGRRVLVTGAGPIGVLVTALVARAGAAEVVTTDLEDHALAVAARMGATVTLNVARMAEALAPWQADKGLIDVAFDCTGAAAALRAALTVLRPRGTLVLVGTAGDTPLPLNEIVNREAVLRGSFRFHAEFAEAVALIGARAVDVRPMLSPPVPLARAAEAFALAGDRRRAVKVQLSFA